MPKPEVAQPPPGALGQAEAMSRSKIKILYIAGLGRSGSTLLAKLLGQLDGFVNVGEAARYLFNAAMIAQDLPCSCGKVVSNCEFWRDIVEDINEAGQDDGREVLRIRCLPLLMSPVQSLVFRPRVESLQVKLKCLYASIAEKARCEVIVDSSKHPTIAYVLSRTQNIELYVAHLVRDPRGVVYSWSNPKEYLPAAPPLVVALRWMAFNGASELLRKHVHTYWRIRYEDLVLNPREVLERLGNHMTSRYVRTDFLQGADAEVNLQHALAGNPDKLSQGTLHIEERGWYLPLHIRSVVSIATFPLLFRYHYAFARASSRS